LSYYLLSNLFTVFPRDASMLRLIRHMSSPVQVHPQTCVPRRVCRPTFKRRLESHLVLPVWSPLATHLSRSSRYEAASQSISRTPRRRRPGSRGSHAERLAGAMVCTVGRKMEGIEDQRSVVSRLAGRRGSSRSCGCGECGEMPNRSVLNNGWVVVEKASAT